MQKPPNITTMKMKVKDYDQFEFSNVDFYTALHNYCITRQAKHKSSVVSEIHICMSRL